MDARDRIIEQRMAKRRKNALIIKSMIAFLILLIIVLGIILVYAGLKEGTFAQMWSSLTGRGKRPTSGGPQIPGTEAETGMQGTSFTKEIEKTLKEAEHFAAQYDYLNAIELLRNDENYNTSPQLQNALASYQAQKDACAAYPIDQIPHVFFHTLIKDTAKAFDGDENEAGYNQVMTTISCMTCARCMRTGPFRRRRSGCRTARSPLCSPRMM